MIENILSFNNMRFAKILSWLYYDNICNNARYLSK